MSIDETKRYRGIGWPCAHCCATGTEPHTGLDEGQRRVKCTATGCDDGFVMLTGYHDDSELPVKRGDRIRIPKGTLIKTICHGERLAGRTYVITVDHVLNGAVAHGSYPASNPMVRWPGPGSYWSEADMNDVEPFNPDAVRIRL